MMVMKKRQPTGFEEDMAAADSAIPGQPIQEVNVDNTGSLRYVERTRERKAVIAEKERPIENNSRYFGLYFFVLYLVLPSVTTSIFGMFPTINVDPDGVSGAPLRFMRNDLSIAQDSHRYHYGVIWAAVFILVYPIGVPLLYLYVLYANKTAIKDLREAEEGQFSATVARDAFRDPSNQQKSFIVRSHERVLHYITPSSIFFLYGAYEGQFWYWEVVETLRRILLTAVISVVSPGKESLDA
jgi:hypothetical protein